MSYDAFRWEPATFAQLCANIERDTNALHASISRRLDSLDAALAATAALIAQARAERDRIAAGSLP